LEKSKIKIDVVSDVACPWCFVGKRRLESALEQWKGSPVEVEWHPFQLDPNMREEGMNRNTYLTNKFGDIARVQDMTDRLAEVGKKEGIHFDFGDEWLAVNTLPLHKLLHVARKEGFGAELKERFLSAYFEETKHLNRRDTLYQIVSEFGWQKDKVDSVLDDAQIEKAVKEEIYYYQQRGVTGVPFFVINDKYGFSGAQPVATFLEAFRTVSAEDSAIER